MNGLRLSGNAHTVRVAALRREPNKSYVSRMDTSGLTQTASEKVPRKRCLQSSFFVRRRELPACAHAAFTENGFQMMAYGAFAQAQPVRDFAIL